MESFEIKTEDTANNPESLLADLFHPGNRAYELLKSSIAREFRPNGAPDVTRMTVDRIKYDSATSKGSFRVLLDITYTFGCEDLVTQKNNETSEWTFLVNTDSGTITFSGSPYADSRSTADEF
ncbi:hypothetical protein [Mucilaginibacter flavidus]|uniref:hypothetical protein n=1 Tax=Mucilaginibacter flavidus TaxID=2949309 RepID=UPI002092A563|nr:hypothetical protein [Mucilaginibacter flavidus]MCO5947924.1 hypothetical protein [Mucilaginibacter flavidus]